MAAPASTDEFLDLVRKSGVTDERRFTDYVTRSRAANSLAGDASRMAGLLVRDGLITQFQAEQILQGKWRRFTIGKYKVLEKIGAGGMGSVFLCEHKLMRRRVAVKVLPTAKATDPSALERFYREARAVAALDHPNIVHAYDIDQDEQLHFLVMEYVDGSNLQDIVKKGGPMEVLRACHYMRQAALGLGHANQAGLVHRDIKPGNILVDRTGCVKILDMGLARFFNDEEDMLTKKFDENVLGTADYLAPEQAIDSHGVDIRADIYSLGATFYFMLTGRTAFGEGTVAQKLLWHQTRQPKPVSEYRKDLPPELVAIVSKMMEKEPANRFQLPGDLADALTPFTQTPIGPPPESEMPSLSPAAAGTSNVPQEHSSEASNQGESPAPRALQGMGAVGVSKAPSGGGHRPSPLVETSANANAASNTPVSPVPKPKANVPASPAKSSIAALPPKSPRPAPNLPTPRNAPPPSTSSQEVPWQTLADADSQATFEPADEIAPPKKSVTPKAPAPKANSPKPNPPKTDEPGKGAVAGGSQTRWYLITAGVVALLAIIVGLFVFLNGPRIADSTATTWEVSSEKAKKGKVVFPSVLKAMQSAKKGDIIQLNDDRHEECLDFREFPKGKALPTDLTIRAAPEKQVIWGTKNAARPDLPLLSVGKAINLKIQGITFDGELDAKDRVKDLVEVYATTPGLKFENVHFQAFEKSGVKFMSAAGEANNPIRVVNCEFKLSGAGTPDAAVVFDFDPRSDSRTNSFIEFDQPIFNADLKGLHARALRAGVLGEQIKLNDIKLPK